MGRRARSKIWLKRLLQEIYCCPTPLAGKYGSSVSRQLNIAQDSIEPIDVGCALLTLLDYGSVSNHFLHSGWATRFILKEDE